MRRLEYMWIGFQTRRGKEEKRSPNHEKSEHDATGEYSQGSLQHSPI